MKKAIFFIPIILVIVIVSQLKAQIPEGQLIEENIPAPSLSNNVFNDITNQTIAIYLPPTYDNSNTNYPVVYFLPGYSTPIYYFTTYGVFQGFMLKESMDTLIYEGLINEMIVVIPNGLTFMLGSFYSNSPIRGNWEDYITEDLVGYVDNNFRTLPNASSRGIAGHSMGGFGALNLAMLHPDIYCAAYGLSPGLFDLNGLSNIEMFSNPDNIIQYLEKEEEFNSMTSDEAHNAFVAYIDSLVQVNNNSLIFPYAYGTAFSPNPDNNAPYIDYPYYFDNNGIVQDILIWQNWENGFGGLEEKVETYKENLLELEAYTIDYGIYDYFSWIPDGCVYFSQLLTEENIPHELLSFNGGHSDMVRQRIEEQIFPFFSNILECDTLASIHNFEYEEKQLELNNYPNPFNPFTTISFDISRKNAENTGLRGTTPEQAKIEIYNIKGQKIRTFNCHPELVEGQSSIVWDGTDTNKQPVGSGVYLYKLCLHPDLSGKAGKLTKMKRMLLLK